MFLSLVWIISFRGTWWPVTVPVVTVQLVMHIQDENWRARTLRGGNEVHGPLKPWSEFQGKYPLSKFWDGFVSSNHYANYIQNIKCFLNQGPHSEFGPFPPLYTVHVCNIRCPWDPIACINFFSPGHTHTGREGGRGREGERGSKWIIREGRTGMV